MENKKSKQWYTYIVKYMSSYEDNKYAKETEIKSDKELEIGQDIIVGHQGKGVFIGKVKEDTTHNWKQYKIKREIAYRFYGVVDLKLYYDILAKRNHILEVLEEMKYKKEQRERYKDMIELSKEYPMLADIVEEVYEISDFE